MAISLAQAKLDVARLYIASFNRVADGGGLDFWVNAYLGGLGMSTMANNFMQSAEGVAKYPTSMSNSAFLDAIYQNVLGRAADAGGKAFWEAALSSGTPRYSFVDTIINAAIANGSSDGAMLQNKAAYGVYCATNGIDATTAAINLLTITSDTATLDAVSKTNLGFNLTTGVDGLTGGSGDDTFSGTASTTQTTDIIQGNTGTDTLLLEGTTTLPNINGVEIIVLKNSSGSFDISSKSDVALLSVDSPTGNADYILDSQSFGIQNAATTHTYNLKYGATAAATAISLNGVGSLSNKSVLNVAAGTTMATLNITTDTTASYIALQNSGYTPLAKLNLYGNKALELDISDSSLLNLKTIDTSTDSGSITLTLANTSDVAYTITGGFGSDIFDFGNRLTSIDIVNGGASADSVKIIATATATTDANFKGIENIICTGQTTLTLTNQTENFTITGSGYDDTITAGLGGDTINAGSGNDTIYTANGGGIDKIDGGAGDDTITTTGSLSLVGDSNITSIEKITISTASTLDISDQTDSFIIEGSSGADTIKFGSGVETIKFASTAALNGIDTMYNFDITADKFDITIFLGENSAMPNTTEVSFATGLDLSSGKNSGVIYNKSGATLLATDIATVAAASKIALDDNGKALVFITTDSDGVSDSINSTYSMYFIEDTDATVGSSTFAVTKVGVLTNTTELNAADLADAIFI